MTTGHLIGTAGDGATGTYKSRTSPTVDIAPNNDGSYTVTYQFWIFFAGEKAYKVFVNGIEPDPGAGYLNGSASWIPDASSYDCLNGKCVEKTQYNTPGLYQSLADCQAVCANGGACSEGKKCVDPTTFCPDGKVCIDQGEFNSIETLISQIGSEVC